MFLVDELSHGIRKEIVKRHELVTSLVEFLPITMAKGTHQVAHMYKVEIVVICPWLRMLVIRAEHRGGVDGLLAGFTFDDIVHLEYAVWSCRLMQRWRQVNCIESY